MTVMPDALTTFPSQSKSAGSIQSAAAANDATRTRRAHERRLVTVVIPGYNEAEVLERNLAAIMGYLHGLRHQWRFEVLLVNDGSRDETGEIAERLMATYPNLSVIHHPANFGLGQALKTAFAASRGDYVITLDVDLSYSVRTIETLLSAIDGTAAKLVLASPYMEGGRTTNVPRLRLVLSRWANHMFSWLSGKQHVTFTCMVRAYDGPFIRALEPKAQGMGIMPEIVYKTMILGGRIEEVPAHLDWTAQLVEAPKRSSSMRLLSHIVATAVSGFVFRPFMLLLLPGVLALLVALFAGGSWLWQAGAGVEVATSTAVLAIGALILAVQLLGLGAVSLQGKKYYEETYFQMVKLRRQIGGQQPQADKGERP